MGKSHVLLYGNSTIYSVQPPDDMLRKGKHTGNFFKYTGNIFPGSESWNGPGSGSAYKLLTEEDIEAVSFNGFLEVINSFSYMPTSLSFIPFLPPPTQREFQKPKMGKWYFPRRGLGKLILTYPWQNSIEKILSGLFSTLLFQME
jgi:dual specificity protein kinase YAK1